MQAASVDVPFLWKRLLPQLAHLSIEERRRVGVALLEAFRAHDGQFRKSGEPFITHPVEVARILGGLRLDSDTIIAGLLHDTVEDTDRLSFDDIQQRFGEHVRRIVEAETRLTKLGPTGPGECVKDVDFRHFFMCISEDVRIVLVKLADRLHNMRTMDSMKSAKQKEKASETLQIYAPLAGVLGLDAVKEEMQDLSLRYLDPERYFELKDHLKKLQSAQKGALESAQETLEQCLKSDALLSSQTSDVTIASRQKSVYSLYKLYERSGWDLEGNNRLRQVAQLHVVLRVHQSDEEAAKICYYVMGLVHLLWSPIPSRFKDSIATPKLSSWRGISTTVWPSCGARLVTPIEVLIQTTHMTIDHTSDWSPEERASLLKGDEIITESTGSTDEDAEEGLSSLDEAELSHSLNGLSNGRSKSGTVTNRVNSHSYVESADVRWKGFGQAQSWVDNFQKWQKESGTEMSIRDYVDCVRDDFLVPSVYVFTPAGELVQLPRGATVLDFAYHIHTDVGNRAIAAKVDGCSVSPGYVLKSAQVVEILTKHWKRSREHLEILKSRMPAIRTTSAKRKLRNFLKKYSKELNQKIPDMLEDSWKAFQSGSSFWLEISCEDKKGVLAEVSGVISELGINISKHTGHKQTDGGFLMKCVLRDLGGSHAPELKRRLEAIEGCIDVVMGCTLPSSAADALGWVFPESPSDSSK